MKQYDCVSYAVNRFREPITECASVSVDKNRHYTSSGLCTESNCAGMYSMHGRVIFGNRYEFQLFNLLYFYLSLIFTFHSYILLILLSFTFRFSFFTFSALLPSTCFSSSSEFFFFTCSTWCESGAKTSDAETRSCHVGLVDLATTDSEFGGRPRLLC